MFKEFPTLLKDFELEFLFKIANDDKFEFTIHDVLTKILAVCTREAKDFESERYALGYLDSVLMFTKKKMLD